jgi:hypothetical protein
VKVGLTGVVGTTNFGAGGGVTGAGGTTVAGPLEAGLGAATLGSAGGGATTDRGGAVVALEDAGGCCLLLIAFRTSPGREIFDKSILVLISSDSGRLAREDLPAGCASFVARKCARTLSASKSSMELECVFFSVTPTAVSASRIALLLTSSSLARSLIRILLIRPFFPPDYPAKSSSQPHGVSFQFRVFLILEDARGSHVTACQAKEHALHRRLRFLLESRLLQEFLWHYRPLLE